MFVYTQILAIGTLKGFLDIVTGFVGVFFFAAFMQGYWVRKNTRVENLLFAAGSLMLFTPYVMMSIVGLVMCCTVWGVQWKSKKSAMVIRAL
jgi:TRAP-type uncharacterized transport system fused permease subunit